MKILKMAMYSLCIASALALSLYGLNYYSNEEMIKKVQDNVFVSNQFSWLGFMEPWVEYYNEGISLQHQKKYDEAIEKYDQALETSIPWFDSCAVRINKTLSMLAPIVPEEITLENIDDTINLLEDCKMVLYEDGCADDKDNGHNEEAQQLYNDIDEWIDELKKQKQEMQKQQEEEKKEEEDKKQNGESQDQDENQNQNQDQNQENQNNENQDQNNGGEDEQKDGDQQDGEDEEPANPDEEEGDEEKDDGEEIDPEAEREKELKSAFDDLQNQAFIDRTKLEGDDAEPGEIIVVEEYW